MLQFLKYVLATIIGMFLFFVVSFFIMAGIGSMLASSGDSVSVKENSVLKIDMNQEIVENAAEEDPFTQLMGNGASKISLIQIKEVLVNAALDPNIKGVYLDLQSPSAGLATIEEIREALIQFKKSGKFIYTYAEYMTEPAVYLASVADKSFINEAGGIEFNGLSAQMPFFKGMLEKIGVKPEIFRVGEFKSAVEPFIRTDMSPENKMQVTSYINSVADHIYGNIAKSRGIGNDEIQAILSNASIQQPEDAVKYKILTDTGYFDQFEEMLKEKLGVKKDAKISYIDLDKYAKAKKFVKDGDRNNRIAVIIGQGDIVSGSSNGDQIASESWIKELKKARDDKKVKAIVLRINSGGGSAMASDVMWREIQLAKKVKPVIASMGDYAASGGYYMAMGCDSIVADPTTITGSIGIFGMLINAQELLNNKLGITFDGVESHQYADFPSVTHTMTDAEKMMIQNSVNKGYEKFTSKAAAGRKMDIDKLKAIAGGRVWTGSQAIENGLVDKLGTLEDAIALAAKKAKTSDYQVKYYPKAKTEIEIILEKLQGTSDASLKAVLGDLAPFAKEIQNLKSMEKLQARMPYQLIIQ